MLRFKVAFTGGREAGDTLIEVTIALAILSFVLLGSTVVAATAFRMGQTAQERTQVSDVAQEQMEALRSFRDNHSWAQFEAAINPVASNFHMELVSGASTEWVPKAGNLTPATAGTTLTVPTAVISISNTPVTPGGERICGYDFRLNYTFTPQGNGAQQANQIQTRLANLKFNWDTTTQGPAPCP